MEKQPNIQDGFLNSVRREKTLVTIYLVSGAKLRGRIRSFDKYSVVIESGNQEQLIFKHSISTVVPPHSGDSAAPSTQASTGSLASAPAAAAPSPSATPAETRREG